MPVNPALDQHFLSNPAKQGHSGVARGQRVRALVLYNSFGTHGWLDHLASEVLAEVDVVLGGGTRRLLLAG
ncbi:MAG: hypothetical protein ACRDT0_13835 [Pseudonocardiaceae bacterium]